MARLLTFSLMCTLAITLVSAQSGGDKVTPNPSMTDELQLNSNIDTNTNSNTNNNNNTPLNSNDGSKQQENLVEPPRNDLIQPNTDEEDFPPQPFNFFGRSPLFSLFDSLRRHQQELDQQFQQLEQQAGEGQEVSYFSRNGVSYTRTCTTRRVSN